MFALIAIATTSGCGARTPLEEEADGSDARGPSSIVALFDNFDPDQASAPFDDRLTLLRFDHEAGSLDVEAQVSGLNTTQSYGGFRAVSASPDGTRIATVELGSNVLSIVDETLTSVVPPVHFVESPHGVYVASDRVYVAEESTASGDRLRAFDLATGAELSGSPSRALAGFDVVVDERRNAVWTLGSGLNRGDASTLAGASVATFDGSDLAVSIDVADDGSVWVAAREYYADGGTLSHFESDGASIPEDTHPWASMPYCVRVNPMNGDVWVAHDSGLSRIDVAGEIYAVETSGKYWSLAVDPTRGYVWAAGGSGNAAVSLYEADGSFVTTTGGVSADQKYLAFAGRDG